MIFRLNWSVTGRFLHLHFVKVTSHFFGIHFLAELFQKLAIFRSTVSGNLLFALKQPIVFLFFLVTRSPFVEQSFASKLRILSYSTETKLEPNQSSKYH